MHTTGIVGREEELYSIRRFLGELAAGPAALVISGEPGIGKTVLWEIACEDARRRPGRVLSWRGVEAEAMLAFAGLSELLTGVLDGVAPTLAGPRRRALEVALLLAEPNGQGPDAHAIGLALVDVLGSLCQTGPVLVALDDVQWLDASSVAVLQVAMRRLREQPVGVLMTLRAEPRSRMMNIDPALERNRAFAAAGGHQGAVVFPNLRLFVITCLDPRVDPAHFLGLGLSDAIVVRNVGGRVTPEVINDVAFITQIAENVLPDGLLFEVAVIHHTQCGAGALADDAFRRRYAERIGADESTLREQAIIDPVETVTSDVERLRSAPAISPRVTVSGHVYDVVTGLVQTIRRP